MEILSDTNGLYQLPLDELIKARVSATNPQGDGEYSAANTEGINIQTIP
jgi:hypothetical protein